MWMFPGFILSIIWEEVCDFFDLTMAEPDPEIVKLQSEFLKEGVAMGTAIIYSGYSREEDRDSVDGREANADAGHTD